MTDLTDISVEKGRWPWKTMEVGDYFIGPTILQTQVSRRGSDYGRKYVSVKVSGTLVKITRMPDDFVKQVKHSTKLPKIEELDTLVRVRGGYKTVYPWTTMEVGQRFRLNVKSRGLVHLASKQHNLKFRTEAIPLLIEPVDKSLSSEERSAKFFADKLLPRFVWVIRMPDDFVPVQGNPKTNGLLKALQDQLQQLQPPTKDEANDQDIDN